MQSSSAGETSRTMSALSGANESTTPSSRSHASDTPTLSLDQFTQYQRRVGSASILEVQTSENIPASNSENNRDPDQDPDNPLTNREDAIAAQPGDAAERYVSWFGGGEEYLGIIPDFLLGFSFDFFLLMMIITVTFFLFCLSLPNRVDEQPLISNMMVHVMAYLSIIGPTSPLILLCGYLHYCRQSSKLSSRIVIILICACLFGLLHWAYCRVASPEFWIRTWYRRAVPQSFRGCDARVEPKQASLFETDIYYTQFARKANIYNIYTYYILSAPTVDIYVNSTSNVTDPRVDTFNYNNTFDLQRFRSIQVNQTLCNQGFEGNNDLYGLGIRTSLYLQWLSSFLANNFLPGIRQELRKTYLIFSMAICLATIILSFVQPCTFSIEIEIMYWMYWGGYVCVFASAPCSVRLGSDAKWIKLNWTTIIMFTTHVLMIYHGAWFVIYAYDQIFSRMPCGTYHFFLLPILDPSEVFWTLRHYLNHLLLPFTPALLATFPFVGLLLASEAKYTVQHSAVYQTFFPKPTISNRDQPQITEYNTSAHTYQGLQVYLFITYPYRVLRNICGLPSHRRGGIRLVTPIDVKDRRLYRIRWAAMGLLSYILSIVAIEVILKWNKVTSINSIASTGQYVALSVGVGGFVSVSWTLVLQESERRRNLKRRQVANQDEDGIELDTLSHNLRDAISHAFSQPDIGFSTNGGAFPITSNEEEEGAVRSLNTPRPSTNTEVFMNGALDVQPDLEAQTPPTR